MITPTDVHTFIQKYAREINFDPNKAALDNTDLARQKENEIAAKKYAEKRTGVMRLKGGETESGYRSPTITGAAAKTPEESKALLNKAMRR